MTTIPHTNTTPASPSVAGPQLGELELESRTGTERVPVSLADRYVRLGTISVADAARAAQDVMGFRSGSWGVVRQDDGSRVIGALVRSDVGGPVPNIDADIYSSARSVPSSSALEAVVGYHTIHRLDTSA